MVVIGVLACRNVKMRDGPVGRTLLAGVKNIATRRVGVPLRSRNVASCTACLGGYMVRFQPCRWFSGFRSHPATRVCLPNYRPRLRTAARRHTASAPLLYTKAAGSSRRLEQPDMGLIGGRGSHPVESMDSLPASSRRYPGSSPRAARPIQHIGPYPKCLGIRFQVQAQRSRRRSLCRYHDPCCTCPKVKPISCRSRPSHSQ